MSSGVLISKLHTLPIDDLVQQYTQLGLVMSNRRNKLLLIEELANYLISFNDPTGNHPWLKGRLLESVQYWMCHAASRKRP
jgi:hypothetical protein